MEDTKSDSFIDAPLQMTNALSLQHVTRSCKFFTEVVSSHCACNCRCSLNVAYLQSLKENNISPEALGLLGTDRVVTSDDPVVMKAFISRQYMQGVRRFVLNLPSSLLEPLLPVIKSCTCALFANTYSSADKLRLNASSNCLFCVTANAKYLPEAFAVALSGETSTGPLITVVSGEGAYIADVEAFSRAQNIPTYRLPNDAADAKAALQMSSAVAVALEGEEGVSDFNSDLLAYSGSIYSLDISISLSKEYFLVSTGVSLVLNDSDESPLFFSASTKSILPNNSAAISLVRMASVWQLLRRTNLLASGSTNFKQTLQTARIL